MAIDLAALKAELQLPAYAANIAAGAMGAVSAQLNAVSGTIDIDRGVLEAYEVVNATDSTEWALLLPTEKQRYQTIVGAGKVDSKNANVRAAFLAMFGAGTATRAALIAMLTRKGSRAEQLLGTSVSYDDITRALRS